MRYWRRVSAHHDPGAASGSVSQIRQRIHVVTAVAIRLLLRDSDSYLELSMNIRTFVSSNLFVPGNLSVRLRISMLVQVQEKVDDYRFALRCI